MIRRPTLRTIVPVVAAVAVAATGLVGLVATGSDATTSTEFDMVRSAAARNTGCLADAQGHVRVEQRDQNERMTVSVSGLPPNTGFDLFVIQLPDAPFGVAWYQSDLQTQADGQGHVTVEGRFNHETFSLSQGGPVGGADPTQGVTGPAVKDTNVVFRPTSQFHLGLWFNRQEDAAAAHCAPAITPFNGEQHAGSQILSTRNFAADHGPLEAIG